MHQDVRACSSISFPDQVQSMVADLGMRYGNVATLLLGRHNNAPLFLFAVV